VPSSVLLVVGVAVLGLALGSFLNVVIHRLPRGESLWRPGSHCPACGAPVRVVDNVPLLSYLVLRGRCRGCRAPISRRYPLVEAATAAACVGCLLRFGPTRAAVVAGLFCGLLLALAVVDLEHYLLPDSLTLPGIALGWLAQLWHPDPGLLAAVNGALIGGGLLFLLGEAWAFLREEEALGLGDAKLLAMVGAFLGWKGVVTTLALGSLVGALVGLALMLAGRAGLKSRLPFGTFLAAGAAVALFAGPALLEPYLRLWR
jgi:leader peptidase (prepilin peptidase)/N-methyltransferase